MMHESGTGGAPKYGVVSQLPVLGNITNPLLDYQTPRAAGDQGTVGYYKTALNNGITVELTASQHAGIMRHTFVDASKGANVLVDVSHFLPSFRGLGIEQHYLGGSIALDGATGRYTGSGRYNGGWNRGEPCATANKRRARADQATSSTRVDDLLLRSIRPVPGIGENIQRERHDAELVWNAGRDRRH